jgi:hypothetical protein
MEVTFSKVLNIEMQNAFVVLIDQGLVTVTFYK